MPFIRSCCNTRQQALTCPIMSKAQQSFLELFVGVEVQYHAATDWHCRSHQKQLQASSPLPLPRIRLLALLLVSFLPALHAVQMQSHTAWSHCILQ